MLFLTFSLADIYFAKKELELRSYTVDKALATTKWVEIIDKKEFALAALNLEDKTFVLQMVSLLSIIHPSRKA